MEYQVYYFEDEEMKSEPVEHFFKSRRQALKYYNEHKGEGFGWFVAKIDEDGFIVEDIIY